MPVGGYGLPFLVCLLMHASLLFVGWWVLPGSPVRGGVLTPWWRVGDVYRHRLLFSSVVGKSEGGEAIAAMKTIFEDLMHDRGTSSNMKEVLFLNLLKMASLRCYRYQYTPTFVHNSAISSFFTSCSLWAILRLNLIYPCITRFDHLCCIVSVLVPMMARTRWPHIRLYFFGNIIWNSYCVWNSKRIFCVPHL